MKPLGPLALPVLALLLFLSAAPAAEAGVNFAYLTINWDHTCHADVFWRLGVWRNGGWTETANFRIGGCTGGARNDTFDLLCNDPGVTDITSCPFVASDFTSTRNWRLFFEDDAGSDSGTHWWSRIAMYNEEGAQTYHWEGTRRVLDCDNSLCLDDDCDGEHEVEWRNISVDQANIIAYPTLDDCGIANGEADARVGAGWQVGWFHDGSPGTCNRCISQQWRGGDSQQGMDDSTFGQAGTNDAETVYQADFSETNGQDTRIQSWSKGGGRGADGDIDLDADVLRGPTSGSANLTPGKIYNAWTTWDYSFRPEDWDNGNDWAGVYLYFHEDNAADNAACDGSMWEMWRTTAAAALCPGACTEANRPASFPVNPVHCFDPNVAGADCTGSGAPATTVTKNEQLYNLMPSAGGREFFRFLRENASSTAAFCPELKIAARIFGSSCGIFGCNNEDFDWFADDLRSFIKVDWVEPTVSDNGAAVCGTAWRATDCTGASAITLTASDTRPNGNTTPAALVRTFYCVDTTNTCTPSTLYTGPVSITCANNTVCGAQYLRYDAIDDVGNRAATASFGAVRIDKQLPTAGSPNYAAANITASSYTVTWTAGSDGSGSGIRNYDVIPMTASYTNGQCGTFTERPSNGTTAGTSLAVGSLASGQCYRWWIKTRDNVDWTTDSGLGNIVRVDYTNPTPATTTYAATNLTVTSFTVTWTEGSDAYSDVQNQDVLVQTATYIDGNCGAFGSLILNATVIKGVASYGATGLSSGQCYRWTIRTRDWHGNVADSAAGAVVRVDTSAPSTAVMTYPAQNITTTSHLINWTAGSDSQSDVQYQQVLVQTAIYTTGNCGAFGAWILNATVVKGTVSYTATGLSSGQCYRWHVSTYNWHNLITNATAGPIVRVDTTAPTPVTLTYPPQNITVTSHLINWTGSADPESDIQSKEVWAQTAGYIDGACGSFGALIQNATVAAGATSYTATGLASGQCYRWEVRAVNWHNLSTSATGEIVRVDTSAPTVTFNGPAAAAWFRRNFVLDVSDADAQSGFQSCDFQVETFNGSWRTSQAYAARTCNSAASATVGVWSPVSAGTYAAGHDCRDSGQRCRVTVRTVNWNNLTATSGPRTFGIDWDGPDVNITWPNNSGWVNATFPVQGPETDMPPGATGTINSGISGPCTLRVADVPPWGSSSWSVRNWTTYNCANSLLADPNVTVGLGMNCRTPSENYSANLSWPRTCLVVTGARDDPANPSMLYYPLDENTGPNATDLGPYGLNGTLQGGASWAANGGYFRHGVSFDGVNDAINATLDPGLNLTGGPLTNMTVEFWMKSDANDRGIFSFCDPPGTCVSSHDRHIYTNSLNQLCMRVWGQAHDTSACGGTVSTTAWQHVALRITNGSAADLFLNGSSVAAAAAGNHSEFDWASNLSIGFSLDGANDYFDGTIDEVKIHFRPLTTAEILKAAQGQEVGGARHLLVDFSVPNVTFNSPAAGTNFSANFTINVSDEDNQSGLQLCEYRVVSNLIETRPWTPRNCSADPSATILVGKASTGADCRNEGINICTIYVRATNYAGMNNTTSRSFNIELPAPALRIVGPAGVREVGMYTNETPPGPETCSGTVANCADWWYRRLTERGYAVTYLNKSQMNELSEMQAYALSQQRALLNPYGAIYPGLADSSSDPQLQNVKSFVEGAGFWFDSGGYTFSASWAGAPGPGSAGSQTAFCDSPDMVDVPGAGARPRNGTYAGLLNKSSPSVVEGSNPTKNTGRCGTSHDLHKFYRNAADTESGPAAYCFSNGCLARTDSTLFDVADAYADLMRYWQNSTFWMEIDDDRNATDCEYQINSGPTTPVGPNTFRTCNANISISVGPGQTCRHLGLDTCWVFVNSTNFTGDRNVTRVYGVDWLPPNASLSLSESSVWTYANASGTTIHYNNNIGSATFTVASGATDDVSGVARVFFPATTSAGGNTTWQGPPHTWTYDFDTSDTFDQAAWFVVYDNATNARNNSSTQFIVDRDITGPLYNTGPVYENGNRSVANVPILLPTATDNESGIQLAGRFLMKRSATLDNGTCASWTNWSILGSADPPLSLTDTNVSHNNCYQYSYNVTDNVWNWNNTTSSSVVRIDLTAPSLCFVLSITDNSSYIYVPNNTTIYYNNLVSGGGFNVTVTAQDPQSNISNVTFPTTVSPGGVQTAEPYLWTYAYDAADTYDQDTGALCYNGAGITGNATFRVDRDITAPTGNSGPSYTDGYYNQPSVPITLPGSITDDESGMPTSGRQLMRRSATLTNTSCVSWSAWSLQQSDPGATYNDTTVEDAMCYQYSYNVTDNVVNWANTTSTSIAKIDLDGPENGSITYSDGTFDILPEITFDPGNDPESGITGWDLYRTSSSLSCNGQSEGDWGPWTLVGNNLSSPYTDGGVSNNTANQWKLVVTNGAGLTTEYTSPNIYIYNPFVDPNATKQLVLYEWQATYTAASPRDRWAFHNSSLGALDGFTITQTATGIEVWRNGTTTFAGHRVTGSFPQTHTYKVAYDYACGSGNYTYVYRNGTFIGRAGGTALIAGDAVKHLESVNTQIDWFITAPGRWDPSLSFISANTNAAGCTNYVLDFCQISGARPCTGSRVINALGVNLSVVRPGQPVRVSPSFCPFTGSSDISISYNAGNQSGWVPYDGRENQASCLGFNTLLKNAGNPGVHRVRASIRDSAESNQNFTCGTWDADNDEVAFWVAEAVRG